MRVFGSSLPLTSSRFDFKKPILISASAVVDIMSIRILSLRRGKGGDTQNFSRSTLANPSKVTLLQDTLTERISQARRSQIWADPTNCSQFACRWNDSFGFLTRPVISQHVDDDNTQWMVGSFTDTVGQVFPVAVPLDEFDGFFSTLVRKEDAARFNLPIYPIQPEAAPGPPPDAPVEGRGARNQHPAPVAGSMERLNWPAEEGDDDDNDPVIVVLPQFLPIGPGQTFPHLHPLESGTSFRDTFPLLEIWRSGVVYARDHNANHSVTRGGPLFHIPGLALDENDPDPTEDFDVRATVFRAPTQLGPDDPRFVEVADAVNPWSDHVWVELGGRLEPDRPDQPPPAGEAFSPNNFCTALEPLINRDKDFRLFPRTVARFRLLLGGNPPADSDTPDLAILPQINDDFSEYLRMASGAAAADELKEMARTAVREANASRICISKDVTFDADAVTLAFSDRIRTFQFIGDRLVSLSKTHAQTNLGFLQLLTPIRAALAQVAEGDAAVKTLVMANTSNSASQIDATKNSQMYTGGRIDSFRCLYEAVCNFRLVCGLAVSDPDRSLLIQKLLEYTDILVDVSGKSFWEAYRNHPHLAIHAYQDLQHILSAFVVVATNSALTKAVESGNQVTLGNYATALAVADGHIHNLRTVVNGNGLGSFRDVPHCSTWFGTPSSGTRPAPISQGPTGTGRGAAGRATPADLAEVTERLRALGALEFDSAVPNAKTDFLDKVTVRAKKRGSRVAERLCMRFLTKGFACADAKCKRPHVPNLNTLPEPDRKKMIEFVAKTPGLSWAPGRLPAGTA